MSTWADLIISTNQITIPKMSPGTCISCDHHYKKLDCLSYRELARLVHWVHAQSLQLCPTLCNSMDCSPRGSSIHRILQGRILEWVAKPSTGGLLNQMIKPKSPASAGRFLTTEPPGKSSSSPLVLGNSRNWRKVWWESRGKTERPAQTQAL